MQSQVNGMLLRSRRLGALGLFALALAALGLFATPDRLPRGQAAPGGAPPEVGVFTAELRKIPVAKEYVGRIDAAETVEVRARIEGFLDKQLFQDGSMVNQGQLLFQIDPRQYEAAVGEAKAKLTKAKADLASAKASVEVVKAKADLVRDQATLANAVKDLARVKPLAEAAAVSIQELDVADTKAQECAAVVDASKAVLRQAEINQKTSIALAEANVEQASASLATAMLDLSYTRCQAPISGRIGKGAVNVGSLVGKGENSLLATISRFDQVMVYFSVSEQQYMAVARLIDINNPTAQTAKTQIELVLADGKLFDQKGRIDFIDRAVDPKTGTLQVRATFPNPTQLLRPGQFARVRVTNPEAEPTVVIPQRAVMEQQGEQFVMVVDAQNNVDRRKVKMGARVDSLWIVEEGLQAGLQVVTDGLQKVKPGMMVKPLKTDR